MLKYLRIFRNKYTLTASVFLFYMLFLDDADIVKIIRQNAKYHRLQKEKVIMQEKLDKTRTTLFQLNNLDALEKFAREEKFFKQDDEDIFIIVRE